VNVLITGVGGQVGTELRRAFRERGHQVTPLPRGGLDITNRAAVMSAARLAAPALIVNAAAYNAVDRAENERDTAFRVNAEGPGNVAAAARETGAIVVHFSTDYVFDGAQSEPYAESASPHPLNVYGASKLAGEEQVRAAAVRHLIIRTSWVFAPHGKSFVRSIFRAMARGQPLSIVDDQVGCPTPAAALANVVAGLAPRLLDPAFLHWGTYHLCGTPPTTWYKLAQQIVGALPSPPPFPVPAIRAVSTAERAAKAVRPPYSVLDTTRAERVLGVRPFDWQAELREVVAALVRALRVVGADTR
jgi:dTDP-4-dehydrorhamnose reductase